MTTDSSHLVRRLIEERSPIRLMMEQHIAELETEWMPTHGQPDWAALRALDFEGEYLRLSEWLLRILSADPFPPEVNGLWFGFLFPQRGFAEPSLGMFLSGSRFFGMDRDWAKNGEVPEDKFVDHSPILLAAYRNLAASDFPGTESKREVAQSFCHLFVALVVAEWSCTIMRHILRGQAESRALFVGVDPWKGCNIARLERDRPGGSGSVVVSWRSTVAEGRQQAEWLTSVRQVANWHEIRWNEVDEWDERRLADLVKLRGAPEVPKRPVVRWFDEELTGRILVDPDVTGDESAFRKDAARCGLVLDEIVIHGRTHVLLPLKRLEVRGVDFRAFDLRGLYPTEERMSFVLLHSKDAPFLNGSIAAVDERSFNRKAYAPPVSNADWYVQSPSVHLRNYFEEWTAEWLAWLRYFFAPNFQYFHRDADEFRYARFLAQHEHFDERLGRAKAMELGLWRLQIHFQVEANRVTEVLEW